MEFDLEIGEDFGFTGGDAISEAGESDVAPPTRLQVFKTKTTQQKLRVLSEANLHDATPFKFKTGEAWHFISMGDVDALSFFRRILQEQKVRCALISTWCMATADAREVKGWVESGLVGRIDFYVGEIFKNGYRGCLDVLEEVCDLCGGRVARFRNHSKVMALFGEDYDCVIEGSANVDTNPRTENTVVTCDSGLARFYKDFYDGIRDFDGRRKDWKPFALE